jgi:hypothetical protein
LKNINGKREFYVKKSFYRDMFSFVISFRAIDKRLYKTELEGKI